MRRLLAAALFILSSPVKSCSAFVQSTRIKAWPVPVVKAEDHYPSLLKAASTSSIIASARITTEEASDELISLLISRRRDGSTKDDEERITSLVSTLTSAKVQFDPSLCLDGPLFVSNVVEGPPPLWERFGVKIGGSGTGKSNGIGNIQGQQYVYRDDEKSVVNYAEILGKAFHVRAYGTYERDDTDSNEARAMQKDNLSMLDNVLEFFGSNKSPSLQKAGNMVQCPAPFTVTVTKGSFFVLGRRFDIPIAGTGYLRVLYADENLRIFVSPKSTIDDRWEKAGLKVAQVNINRLLEDCDFEDLCATASL